MSCSTVFGRPLSRRFGEFSYPGLNADRTFTTDYGAKTEENDGNGIEAVDSTLL